MGIALAVRISSRFEPYRGASKATQTAVAAPSSTKTLVLTRSIGVTGVCSRAGVQFLGDRGSASEDSRSFQVAVYQVAKRGKITAFKGEQLAPHFRSGR
jgi:hypothetical protein